MNPSFHLTLPTNSEPSTPSTTTTDTIIMSYADEKKQDIEIESVSDYTGDKMPITPPAYPQVMPMEEKQGRDNHPESTVNSPLSAYPTYTGFHNAYPHYSPNTVHPAYTYPPGVSEGSSTTDAELKPTHALPHPPGPPTRLMAPGKYAWHRARLGLRGAAVFLVLLAVFMGLGFQGGGYCTEGLYSARAATCGVWLSMVSVVRSPLCLIEFLADWYWFFVLSGGYFALFFMA